MKNDLEKREDIKGIIQKPIHPSFGFKKSTCYMNFEAQESLIAFNVVCAHIGTRDLVQEHLAFNTWPLLVEWSTQELSKDSASETEPRLVRLKFTYKFETKFGEPCDEWLEAIEEKCYESLENYNKDDKALNMAFREVLNHVFDAIEFVYPDYPRMTWDAGKKRKK
jgi:hypothetical protein